ncbi:DHA2 family efflux MFS transporter permease subunit [Streptomyces sp. DSM 42041]|uniref:DHA2 family efflux MFS transporter permease subunit n=1 Tax=Streptomyces hazeniae TaxID=3075538 RepID=A0ABU2NYN6_9ACTN|nr:DHA2 family efflux MFS transporter permease subunit [Streptomyces sp. DSM 42041]MDT0382093.1 DHA2 family efflux MFS transporter permease subunit [Streptomyces sp. DSM 42041]
MTTSSAPGTVAHGSAAGRWVLAATVLGSAMGFLDATVVNVALPAIGDDLDADVSELQWVLDGYLLTLAALILLGGSLADRYGRRRVFSAGVVCFTLPSVLCALAPDPLTLIVARALQGVGAALLTPGSLAIIQAAYRPEDRSRAIGAWSALSGVASALGPLVGGYLIDALSWRWIFLINVPIGLLVLAAAARHVPESRDPTVTGRLDLRGGLLATLALGCLTYALIEGPRGHLSARVIGAALLVGVAASAAFVVTERRARTPMLPFGVFSSRQFLAANAVTVVVYAALGGVFFLLVVFLQTSLGYSPLEAGIASLPVTLLMLLLSSRAGGLAQRIGPRLPLTVGPLLLACGMLLMLRIEAGSGYVTAVLPAVVVFGLGLSATVAPVTATVLAAAPAEHSGVASGINNAVSRVAQLAAVAALPPLAGIAGRDFTDPGALTDGFHTAMLITAALAAAGGLLALFTIRGDVLAEPAAPPEPPEPAPPGAPPAGEAEREREAAPRSARRAAAEPCPYECPMAGAPLRVPPSGER